MSTIKVDTITDEAGSGAPDFPNGMTGSGSALTGIATAAQGALADASVQTTATTGQANLPAGTTAQRTGTPATGALRFNSTDTAFEGYNGTEWASIGGGGGAAQWVQKTTSYTASAGDNLIADTSSNSFTITLPLNPSVGDEVNILDTNISWAANSLTVSATGKTLTNRLNYDAANSLSFDESYYLRFIWDGSVWFFTSALSGENPSNLFLPDWANPDVTISSVGAGVWNAPSGWLGTDVICILMVSGGGGGAGFQYSGQSWRPGGDGGFAGFVIGNVSNFDGMAYFVGGGTNSSGWQRKPAGGDTTVTDVTSNITYGAKRVVSDLTIGFVEPNTTFTGSSPSVVQDAYVQFSKTAINPVVGGIEQVSYKFGNRQYAATSPVNYVTGPAVFSGGNGFGTGGFGTTSASGAVSLYSGNGGLAYQQPGTAPGGGGGGPSTATAGSTGGAGATGSIRIYRQPQ